MRSPKARTLMPALAATLLLALGRPVAADPPAEDKGRAEKLLREGAALYQRGERERAVSKFEEAYSVFPSVKILYNLGKAYRGAGKSALAHRALSRVLREGGAVGAARKKEVEDALAELEPSVGLAVVEVFADELPLAVDGEPVGTSPLAGPVAVEPGQHVITAGPQGEVVAEARFSAAAGERVRVELREKRAPAEDAKGAPSPKEISPVPSPKEAASSSGAGAPSRVDLTSPGPARDAPVYKKWWFWTAVGAAVAVGVTAAVIAGSGEVNDVEPTLGEGFYDFDEF